MEALAKIVGALVLIALIVVGAGLLFSLPVYWLWNGIVSDLFHIRNISWLEAWGLLILCGFLFKSSSTTSSSN